MAQLASRTWFKGTMTGQDVLGVAATQSSADIHEGSSPRPTPSHSRTLLAEHVAPATSAPSPKEDLPLRNECFVPLGPAPEPPRTGLQQVVGDLPTRICLPQGLVSGTFSPTGRAGPISTFSRYEES